MGTERGSVREQGQLLSQGPSLDHLLGSCGQPMSPLPLKVGVGRKQEEGRPPPIQSVDSTGDFAV